ncbi:MAG: TIGR01777 family protein [Deltaproteobacteria bacterium]|nr:TIGR01777 family protein [Deltaproteobacteria bacterium]
MNILVLGGRGFVGSRLCEALVESGHETTVISRSAEAGDRLPGAVRYVSADTSVEGDWQEEIKHQDAVINLAGAAIFRRWTEKSKQLIYDSRIHTTRNLVDVMDGARNTVLVNASAAGYYGSHGDEELTERNSVGADFLAVLAQDWEKEASSARAKGIRVVISRFGVVLGKGGGALANMVPIFKMCLGGRLGSGEQWFSWVHMKDLVGALLFFLDHEDLEGPFNVTSPNPVRNREFTNTLAEVLHRQALLPVPGFMIRLVLGEFGSVLLKGQRAVPRKLLDHGFGFFYPRVREALEEATV